MGHLKLVEPKPNNYGQINLWYTRYFEGTSVIALNWLEPKPTNYNQISDTNGILKAPRLLP